MAEEEIIDFGFSAVTADEYERDNTDGENTGSGGSASPEALASMDAKIEQIMALYQVNLMHRQMILDFLKKIKINKMKR